MVRRRSIFFAALSTVVLTLCSAGVARGDVRLHGIFTDNMVLQQGMKVPVWGWADPGEKITVSLDRCTAKTSADKQGRWMVRLGTFSASTQILTMTVTGKNEVILKNVVIGEVWLASGQSNMDMEIEPSKRYPWRKGVIDYEREVAHAMYPFIRIYTCPASIAPEPLYDCKGSWNICSPETIGEFSAVAYFFGRDIHASLGVPVGLIKSSYGGSPIESWLSLKALRQTGYEKLVEEWTRFVKSYNHETALAHYEQRLHEYEEAKARGLKLEKPLPPIPPVRNKNGPSQLYNGMIAPLIPFALQGVLWYQGESNTHNVSDYCTLFPALIESWREAWGQGNYPFFFVQLPNYREVQKNSATSWPGLREAQRFALRVPDTAMAVTIDVGDPDDIHPRNKQAVGKRLALAARALVYGEDVVYAGPLYQSMARVGQRIRIHFDHVEGGLSADNPEALQGFEIAGEDGVFHPASARIEGKTILVWSDRIIKPSAVRYAWSDDPDTSCLRNKQGLPASPFRTDTWCESKAKKQQPLPW